MLIGTGLAGARIGQAVRQRTPVVLRPGSEQLRWLPVSEVTELAVLDGTTSHPAFVLGADSPDDATLWVP